MGIVEWVLIGLIVGIAASFLAKAHGLIRLGYLAVSVLGSILGGVDIAYLYQAPGAMNGLSLTGVMVACIGAIMACAILRLFGPRKRPETQGEGRS